MTFIKYQDGVRETWNHHPSLDDQEENAIYGLIGELGELVEMHKKSKFHGIPINSLNEVKEMGDILYYLTALIDVRGKSLNIIAEENLGKLKRRYPNGFVEGGGIR